jgi:hypothetical protein
MGLIGILESWAGFTGLGKMVDVGLAPEEQDQTPWLGGGQDDFFSACQLHPDSGLAISAFFGRG